MDHLLEGWNLWDSDKNLQLLLEDPGVSTSERQEDEDQQQQGQEHQQEQEQEHNQQVQQIQLQEQQIQCQIDRQQLQQQNEQQLQRRLHMQQQQQQSHLQQQQQQQQQQSHLQQQQQQEQQQQMIQRQHQSQIQTPFILPNISGKLLGVHERGEGSSLSCRDIVRIPDENIAENLQNQTGVMHSMFGNVIQSNHTEEMRLQKDGAVLPQVIIQNESFHGTLLHNQAAIAPGSIVYNHGPVLATCVHRNPIDILQEQLFQSYTPILPKIQLEMPNIVPLDNKTLGIPVIDSVNDRISNSKNDPTSVTTSEINNLIENMFMHENFNDSQIVRSPLVCTDSSNTITESTPTYITSKCNTPEFPSPFLKMPEETKPKRTRICRGVNRLPSSIQPSARLHAYVCDICGGEFSTKFNLKKHKDITHSDAKPWHCEVCGKSFKRKGVLKTHKLTHSEDKPFRCTWCEKRFRRKADLNEHIVIHKDGKPYECMICGNRFTQYSTLRTHILTHSGENRFGCDICGRWFSVHSNLISHKLTHSREQPFQCQICGRKFSLKGNLKRHMADIHSVKNSPV